MEPASPSPLVRLAFLEFERRLRIPVEVARPTYAHFGVLKENLEHDRGLEYLALSGSYGHGTDIYGGSDIDLIAQFPRRRINADSRLCLDEVADAIQARFPNADVGIDSPAVVIRFSSDETVPLDIIPARHVPGAQQGLRIYEIPGASGRWKTIYPDHHKRYVTITDELLGYDVKKLIRILKAWNHLRRYRFSSVFIELFVAQYYRRGARIPPVFERTTDVRVYQIVGEHDTGPELTSVDFASDIWVILGRLVQRRLRGIRDPIERAGTIAAFRNDTDPAGTLEGVRDDLQAAESALRFENSGDMLSALSAWHIFFHELFLDPSGPVTPSEPLDPGPEVVALTRELGDIWRRTGRYLVVDSGPDPRVVEIGQRLDGKGGWRMLSWAAEEVRTHQGDEALSQLSWAWNGIGMWDA
jgi:Second Messenger Oligonucleotide or Dinucleotide Synthetase domain